jgi:DNA repair protein RadA
MTKAKKNFDDDTIMNNLINNDNNTEDDNSLNEESNKEFNEGSEIIKKKTNSIPTIFELPGVGPATAEKLEASGFSDVMSIAVATPSQIVDATGIGEAAARKIIKSARDLLDMGFESGLVVLEKRKSVEKISLGCSSFDNLLEGGFETGSIVECFGEFGSSKTQIGHLLAVNCQKLADDAVAIYIDTENTFRPERIIQFAKGSGLDPDKVLANIRVAKAYNSDHQMLLAEKVSDLIKDKNLNVKVVIIDSLMAHFRAEFIGRGSLSERQQKLNKHMSVLSKLADTHNCCVYVTNQVMSKPDTFFGDPTQAVGGHIVAHASTFRLYLRKGRKGARVAKLIDAPNLPDSECSYFVEESGLRDA